MKKTKAKAAVLPKNGIRLRENEKTRKPQHQKGIRLRENEKTPEPEGYPSTRKRENEKTPEPEAQEDTFLVNSFSRNLVDDSETANNQDTFLVNSFSRNLVHENRTEQEQKPETESESVKAPGESENGQPGECIVLSNHSISGEEEVNALEQAQAQREKYLKQQKHQEWRKRYDEAQAKRIAEEKALLEDDGEELPDSDFINSVRSALQRKTEPLTIPWLPSDVKHYVSHEFPDEYRFTCIIVPERYTTLSEEVKQRLRYAYPNNYITDIPK